MRCLPQRMYIDYYKDRKDRKGDIIMFAENLKTLRKAKGLSQEELAVRLHVVRQTISKWEKGLSVPDASLLIRLSDIFEVSVSELLGSKIENETEMDAIAEQLSKINEQLAIKNRRSRRIWKIAAIVFISFILISFLLLALNISAFSLYKSDSGVRVDVTEVKPDEIPDL